MTYLDSSVGNRPTSNSCQTMHLSFRWLCCITVATNSWWWTREYMSECLSQCKHTDIEQKWATYSNKHISSEQPGVLILGIVLNLLIVKECGPLSRTYSDRPIVYLCHEWARNSIITCRIDHSITRWLCTYAGLLSNLGILPIGHSRRAVIGWLNPRMLFTSPFVIGGSTISVVGSSMR